VLRRAVLQNPLIPCPAPSPAFAADAVPLARLSVIISAASGDFSRLNPAFAAKSKELATSYDGGTGQLATAYPNAIINS